MPTQEQIIEALSLLDPKDDASWTEDGAPKIEAVSAILMEPITRAEIVNAAPSFSRVTLDLKRKTIESSTEETVRPSYDNYPAFLAWLSKSSISETEEVISELENDLNRISSVIDLATTERDLVKKALNQARFRVKTSFKNTSDQQAIRDYINSQNAAREKAAGVVTRNADPRMPIDRAMTRNRSFGANRPKFPVNK